MAERPALAHPSVASTRIALRDGVVDLERALVVRAVTVALSPIEQKLLRYLAARPGQLVPREALLAEVWEYKKGVQTRTIDTTIRRLRRKLEQDPANPVHLLALYGRGLALHPAVAAPSVRRSSRFLGRETESADLADLLATGARLVVLVGPAGAGKSRLAEEIAPRCGLPVRRAELRSARTPDDVDRAVAEAVGGEAGAASVALIRTLAHQGACVLVLDGAEACVEALEARLGAWLAAAPLLRVVATSRRPIDLDGACVVPVGPMTGADGRALFLERAARAAPGFAPDPAAVDALVAALRGLPLWIELAAVRASVCGPRQLLAMLDRRLDLLAGDADAARSLVDGSLALLGEPERRALDGLAAFEGAFTLEDAAAVLGADWVLDTVKRLVDHSLVGVLHGPEVALYAVLDVVRDRVRELGAPPPDAARRHAVRFARWAHARFDGKELRALVAAAPDLRAALARTAATAPELAASCATELLVVYLRVGPLPAALALTETVRGLACSEAQRATLLSGLAEAHRLAGQLDAALALAADGLDARPPAPTAVRLRCNRALALARLGQRDAALAELAIAAEVAADPDVRSHVAYVAGTIARSAGAVDEAAAAFARARSLAPNRRSLVAACLAIEAELARTPADARLRFGEALAAVGSDDGRARAMVHVAFAAFLTDAGALDDAERHLAEADLHVAGLADPAARAGAAALAALVAVRRGAIASAAEQLGRIDVDPATLPSEGAAALAEARWWAGDRAGAARVLAASRAATEVTSRRFRALEVLAADAADRPPLLAAAAEIHARAGRPDEAAIFAAALAMVAVRDGDAAGARRHLADAIARAEELAVAPESAVAAWLGAAARAIGAGTDR